jgi:hypothetical protein
LNAIKQRIKRNQEYEDPFYESNAELLNTIKFPMNIHYLTDRLPGPNYQPLETDANYKTDFGAHLNDSPEKSTLGRRNRGRRNDSITK